MTSRERVLEAIRHRQPELSVLDTFGVDVLDIGRTFNDLPGDWYSVKMANDANGIYPIWFHPAEQPDGSFLTFDDDGIRVLSKMPVGATFFDQTYFPYVDGYPSDYKNLDAEMNRIMWARHVHSPWDHEGERHLATLEKVCKSIGDIVDIIRFGDDLGMTQGPFS